MFDFNSSYPIIAKSRVERPKTLWSDINIPTLSPEKAKNVKKSVHKIEKDKKKNSPRSALLSGSTLQFYGVLLCPCSPKCLPNNKHNILGEVLVQPVIVVVWSFGAGNFENHAALSTY